MHKADIWARLARWKTPWGLVNICVAAVVFPVATLVALRIAGVKISSQQDPLGTATMLAALMGGIFVVGGLVVALAAVVTLLSVEDRVDRRIEALQRTLEDNADRQIAAHLEMVDARSKPWPEACAAIERALGLHDRISGARRQMALQLMDGIERDFRIRCRTLIPPAEPEHVPLSVAATWLDRASAAGEDTDGRLVAASGLLAALESQFDLTLERIRGALPGQRGYLVDRHHLAMLTAACTGDEARMHELATLLRCQLPLSGDAARDLIRGLADDLPPMQSERIFTLYVVGKPGKWPAQAYPHFPAGLRLGTRRHDRTANMQFGLLDGQIWLEEFRDPAYTGWRPIDQVLADLDRLFWVIALGQP